MNRKSPTATIKAVVMVVAVIFTVMPSMADSMLTSSPWGGEVDPFDFEGIYEGILELIPPNPNYTGANGHRLWGPWAEREKPVAKPAPEAKKEPPPINVRYRAYLGKADGGQYRTVSPRDGGNLVSVNITPVIIREAAKNGIPPLLLKAIIQTESTYNTYAVGPTGTLGLCQLAPATARSMGVKDPFNPEENIAGGAKYLGYLYRKFQGNMDMTIAAYNVGPYGVSNGIPSYGWQFVRKVRSRMHW